MKILVENQTEPSDWFLLTDSESQEISTLIDLTSKQLLSSSVIFLSPEHEVACREFARLEPRIGLVFDRIAGSAVRVDPNAGISESCLSIEKKTPGIGAVPALMSSDEFEHAQKTISDPVKPNEDSVAAFTRIFSAHLSVASNLSIIDPFAAKNLADPNSTLRMILKECILANPNIFVEVHTKVFARGTDEDKPRKSDYDLANAEFCNLLDVLRATWPTRNTGMKVYLYRHSARVRSTDESGFSQMTTIKFSHDRHFEFSFRDIDGNIAGSDQFSLGSGLDVFQPDEAGHVGITGAQTYQSDPGRVWSWRSERRGQKLLTGTISIGSEQFGSNDGRLDFVDSPYLQTGVRR